MEGNAKTREKKCAKCGSERVERKGTSQGRGWGSEGFHNQWEQYQCMKCGKSFRLVVNKPCPRCAALVYADNPVCGNCATEVHFSSPE